MNALGVQCVFDVYQACCLVQWIWSAKQKVDKKPIKLVNVSFGVPYKKQQLLILETI